MIEKNASCFVSQTLVLLQAVFHIHEHLNASKRWLVASLCLLVAFVFVLEWLQ